MIRFYPSGHFIRIPVAVLADRNPSISVNIYATKAQIQSINTITIIIVISGQ